MMKKPWIAPDIFEIFGGTELTKNHKRKADFMHHSMDLLFCLENTFTVSQSLESTKIVYTMCE